MGTYSMNKETADHCLPFAVSMIVLEKMIGPEQYTPQKLKDPRLEGIMDKIRIEVDKSIDDFAGTASATITLKDGKDLSASVEYRTGHPKNPMTDDQIKEKFLRMAEMHMGKEKAEECIKNIYDIEDLSSIRDFMSCLVF